MNNDYSVFEYRKPFGLENGETLDGFHLAYHSFGRLNAEGNNAVWVFHALTANSDVRAWWPELTGPGKLLDPDKHFIVCVNMPGSCYGSIGPLEKIAPGKSEWLHDFPYFSVRDMVRTYQALRVHLGIGRIEIGIGGSMGGQQLLEWAIEEPALFEHIIPIATNARHSPWAKAFNASQRWCIESDPTWRENTPEAGMQGMKVARSMALLSYRHYETYRLFQADEEPDDWNKRPYRAATYQQHQGEKLATRFNAFSYHRLGHSMDSHNVGRGRESAEAALRSIRAKTLVIGIASDILFPPSEQEFLHEHIAGSRLAIIESVYGHDGFLLEYEQIENEVRGFLAGEDKKMTGTLLATDRFPR